MEQNKVNESEVLKQMADNSASRMNDLRSMANRAKATSDNASPAVQETSEFSKGAEVTTKELVTKDTAGVYDWVEHPSTPANAMPATPGEVATEPYITYKMKRTLGNTEIETIRGRFRKNKDGASVDVEYTKKHAVDPQAMGAAKRNTMNAQKALIEAASTASTAQATKLRQYISNFAKFVNVYTDHDNKPTLRANKRVKKDENGNTVSTSTGFKVAESGCGPVKYYNLLVPSRAWDAFDTNDYNDPNVVGNICEETNPAMKIVTIPRDEFLGEIGFRCLNGVDVLPAFVDAETCRVVVSEDPTKGVKEHINLVNRLITVDANSNKVNVLTEKQKEKQKKLTEKIGANKAKLSVGFRLVDNARSSIISRTNYIPQKTQKTIPAGKDFKPSEGKSASDMTELYFNTPFRAKIAAGTPFDVALGRIITPTTENNKVKDKFCFGVQLTLSGVQSNPLFYPSETPVEVEPYFKNISVVDGKVKTEKLGGTEVTEIVEKVKNDKSGNLQTVSHQIGTDGYDTSYYDAVKARFQNAVGTDIHFPSLSEISALYAKTKTTGTKRQKTQTIDELIPAFNLAAIADTDPDLLASYYSNVNTEKQLKKDGPKVDMWSNQYNEALKKSLIIDKTEL